MASAVVGLRIQQFCQVRHGLMRCCQSQLWYTTKKDGSKENKSKDSSSSNKTSTKTTGKTAKSASTGKSVTDEKAQPTSVPFDNTSYQVPEYYSHNQWSFYDIENEMVASRVPQPTPIKQATK